VLASPEVKRPQRRFRRVRFAVALVLLLGLAGAVGLAIRVERVGLKVEKIARDAGLTDEDELGKRFRKSVLSGASSTRPTVLQFGPDGRLYVAQQNGLIKVYTIFRDGPGAYRVAATETIPLVRELPNHDDDGRSNGSVRGRQVTGLHVVGTAAAPVLYLSSSDPRIGAGDTEVDAGLDTNSGIVSRLTRSASGWARLDLVRGLPRSEENHSPNGLVLSRDGTRLLVAQGSNTNAGAPSRKFAHLPQYALSAAVLELDLEAIGERTHDLPTLDDDSRPGTDDEGDPFGGNNGKNQARLVPGGPVTVYATGFRNPYDLLLTEGGRLFTVDNGANKDWGAAPAGEGTALCTNERREAGARSRDALHLITEGSYAGHPNPTRGNRANVFNRDRQSPVTVADARECVRLEPGSENGALATFKQSTNGLVEYRASGLRGELRGDLLAVSFDGSVYRIDVAPDGRSATRRRLFADVAAVPLDITAEGDDGTFPGTIWVAGYGSSEIVVLEPVDYGLGRWEPLRPSGRERQEVSYVAASGRLYLAGGGREHEVYDPAIGRWRDAAPLPVSVDHIQGVELGGLVYYIGGLTAWPEPHVDAVLAYDPATDAFEERAPMPRGRGAGGVVAHDGRIYYLGGLHDGDAVAWVDVYDPVANRWSRLPDMPRVRDHFQAAVVGDRLYAIGGRDVDIDATTDAVDVFDLGRGVWDEGAAPLPTPRGGFAVAVVGDEILVIGGEGGGKTFDTVEAYDTRRNRWRELAPLLHARHGISAAVCGGVYVAAGGREQGGGEPSDAHEVFFFGADTPPCP